MQKNTTTQINQHIAKYIKNNWPRESILRLKAEMKKPKEIEHGKM